MALSSEEMNIETEDTQHGRFLTFALGEEVFGIEIGNVIEIIGMQPVTSLPETPDHIKGIINLRGKIIPVIDIRIKFNKESIAYTDRTCIIVIDIEQIAMGLIVDNVAEVVTIDDENIVPPPDERTGIQNRYIRGIGKAEGAVKLLLDCSKLFEEEEVHSILEN